MIVVLPIVMALGISIALFMLGMLGYILFGFFKKLYHDLLHWHMPEDDGGNSGLMVVVSTQYASIAAKKL